MSTTIPIDDTYDQVVQVLATANPHVSRAIMHQCQDIKRTVDAMQSRGEMRLAVLLDGLRGEMHTAMLALNRAHHIAESIRSEIVRDSN